MADVQFYEMDVQQGRDLRDWQRAYGVDENNEFYVPAVIAGDEHQVMLCATSDGISVCRYKKHLYVPLTWAKRAFPEANEVWTAFENRMNDFGVHYSR